MAAPTKTPGARAAVFWIFAALLLGGLLVTAGCGGRSAEGSARGPAQAPVPEGEVGAGNPDPLQEDGLDPGGGADEPAGPATFEAAPRSSGGSTAGSTVGPTAGEFAANVPDASGEWSGTVRSEAGEEGRLQLVLSQQPDGALAGSMVWTLTGQAPVPFEGLTGRAYPDGRVELLWQHPAPEEGGEVALAGSLSEGQSGGQISGEVTSTSDGGAGLGGVTFAVTRLPE